MQSSLSRLSFCLPYPAAPPDQYTLGGDDEPSRTWDHGAVKRHCPFIGLVYPMPTAHAGDDGWVSLCKKCLLDTVQGQAPTSLTSHIPCIHVRWSPPPEAEAVREGLGLAPYPFGIRAPAVGQEHKYVRYAHVDRRSCRLLLHSSSCFVCFHPSHRAVQALIRDWQFLETLGMGPIQLVGGDDEEEEAARREQPGEGADEEGD